MKQGHVVGTKRERQGASDWYKAIEAEHLKQIEAEWQAKQQASSDEYGGEYDDGDLVPWDRAA
jgi:hypothetical protein